MKKAFLIFLIVFLIGNVFAEDICIDSDGGENYSIRGEVSGNGSKGSFSFEDECVSGEEYYNLIERFCVESIPHDKYYQCPNDCKDGACIEGEESAECTDSDGGADYFVKGTVDSNGQTNSDSCSGTPYLDGTLSELTEYYCSDLGLRSIEVRCACKDGACVEGGGEKGCCVIGNDAFFGLDEQQCIDRNVESDYMSHFLTDVLEDDCKMGYCFRGNGCLHSLKSFCTDGEWKEILECFKDKSEFNSCEEIMCSNFIYCLNPFGGFCSYTKQYICQISGGIVLDESDDECDLGCCKGLGDDAELTHFTGRERCNFLSKEFSMEFDIETSEQKCAFINEEGFICIRGYCSEVEDFELDKTRVFPLISPSGTIFTINTKLIRGMPGFFPLEVIVSNRQITDSSSAGVIEIITLFDDGEHGDNRRGDGIYGNTFDSANQPEGDYFVGIEIDGSVENVAEFSISNDQCIEVIKNGDSAIKADIVFVGDGYENTAEFIQAIEAALGYTPGIFNGLFGIEPFKSNKEKFNIWAVDAEDNIRSSTIGSDNPAVDKEVTKRYAKVCILPEPFPFKGCLYSIKVFIGYSYKNTPKYRVDTLKYALRCPQAENIVLLSKRDFRSFCYFMGDCYVSHGRHGDYNTGRVLIHELGHGFAKLRDEYIEPAKGSKTGFNCANTIEEAEGRWGHLTEDNADLGYYAGCSYIEGNYRPTELSIMRSSYSSYVFGSYNEMIIKEKLEKYE